MTRQKRITGTFQFDQVNGSQVTPQADLERLMSFLQARFISDVVRLPPSTTTIPASSAVSGSTQEAPFAVVLTFYERRQDGVSANFMFGLEEKLTTLFDTLFELASSMAGGVGVVANMVAALRNLLMESPHDAAIDNLRAAVRSSNDLDGSRMREAIARMRARYPSIPDFDETTLDELRNLLLVPTPTTGSSPTLSPAPAPTPPPTSSPGPSHTAGDSEGEPATFKLTQLVGVLTQPTVGTYGFQLEGFVRYPDDRAEYGAWGRLDVLGPDGSQLLTCHLTDKVLIDWLYGEGKSGAIANVTATAELRTALANAQLKFESRRTTTVKGRLWLSDGQPTGSRTVAVFVPPILSKIIKGTCIPDDFLEQDDCCDDDLAGIKPLYSPPKALAVTQTDEAGYFEFTYEGSELPTKYARFNVSGVVLPIAVQLENCSLDKQDKVSKYQFPPRLLLEIDARFLSDTYQASSDDERTGLKAEDCACNGTSFQHSEQVLEEFQFDIVVRTTDPMVTRVPIRRLSPADERNLAYDQNDADLILGRRDNEDDVVPADSPVNRFFRTTMSRDVLAEWDEVPTVAQAVTIAHGRILTFRQVWRADGYSLGDLRYSLPLAPLQKKNIAVIDWDRNESFALQSTQQNVESLRNSVSRERDISEITKATLNESIRGRSDSGASSGSGGAGFSLFGIGFGGASAGSSSAWSSSSQDSGRAVSAEFLNRLRDQTVQAANAVRSQRVTTIQQVSESESARAVTETVANRNACHAITVQYFEVLRHFRVECELASVRECLYIPLPIRPFNTAKLLRWRTAISQYLPTPRFREALAATERLAKTPYPGPDKAYADEEINSLEGEMTVILDFPYPSAEVKDGTTWNQFFGGNFSPASPLPSLFETFKRQSAENRLGYFETNVAPVLARKAIQALRFMGERKSGGEVRLPLEATLGSKYRPGGKHVVSIRATDDIANQHIARTDLSAIRIESNVDLQGAESVLVDSIFFEGRTPHRDGVISNRRFERNAVSGTTDVVRIATPPTAQELRNPRLEDELLRQELLEHLNEHIEFYHKAIWWVMDADRRFTLLDGFIAPNSGGRSVASVVENRLAAIVGNCLVMPIAPGIRLDYYDDTKQAAEQLPDGAREEDWLLSIYRPSIPNPSMRISVPTRGVFAESVMGNCNSCEKIENSRNWKHWEHPLPDEPAQISPLSLDSRARDIKDPTPAMAPTVINQVQNGIPNAPDPTGLSAVLTALVNGAAFRDAAGLAGTQQGATEALSESFNTTTRFGELAAEIEMKKIEVAAEALKAYVGASAGVPTGLGDVTQHRDRIMQDRAQNRITPQQAQGSLTKLNDAITDSISIASKSPLDRPEVSSAIENASRAGAPLTVSRGDTRVDVGRAPDTSSNNGGKSRLPWPFGKRATGLRETERASRQARVLIEIVTTIRPGSFEWVPDPLVPIGEKSRQILVLDPEKSTLDPTVKRGTTFGLSSVRNSFDAKLYDSTDGKFVIWAQGQTASGVYLVPDIDYKFRLALDLRRKKIRIDGDHDAFPSYTIFVDGRQVYHFQQHNIQDLVGEGDDVHVAFEADL